MATQIVRPIQRIDSLVRGAMAAGGLGSDTILFWRPVSRPCRHNVRSELSQPR
jgi:hypothetical protein